MKTFDLVLAVTAVLVIPASAQLGLGLNFSGGAGNETAGDPITGVGATAGDLAGVFQQSNWNDLSLANGSNSSLLYSNGTAATGVTVTWSSSNTWGRTDLADANTRLASNYLDGGRGVPANVSITGLPAGLYDVYVYTRRNEDPNFANPANDELSDYTVNGSTQKGFTGNVSPLNENYVLASTTPNTTGNYFRFSNVSAPTVSLVANDGAVGNSFRSPVDGVQIVSVPEPASIGLVASGFVSLLGLGRFRRS